MTEKIINSRIINKHETEANWLKSSLIPKQGELIVYDIDDNYSYERIKVGDGVQNVNELPFANDSLRAELLDQINSVDDKVDAVSALVGDTAVADQISNAIADIPDQVQADLSQADDAATDYVKGVIRYESLPEGYPYKINEFESIIWDGNIEGKDSVVVDGMTYYKISDLALSAENLAGATMTISGMIENGFSTYLPESFTIHEAHVQDNAGVVSVVIEGVCQIMSTSVTIANGSELFPSIGTYVLYIPAGTEIFAPNAPNYCSSLTKETIYKLDPAFYEMPEIPEIPDPDVFWATYGSTTFEEITSAVEEGKTVLVKNNNYICRLSCLTSTLASFLGADANWKVYFVFCENNDSWNWNWLNMVSTAATHEITGKLIFDRDALQLKSPDGSIYQITLDDNGIPTFVCGNRSTTINPIIVDDDFSTTSTNPVQNKVVNEAISNLNTLVGDTSVSEQISTAINEATADDFGIYVQDAEPTEAVAGDIWVDTANDPSYIPPTIPEITAADNGKVLMVVNGKLQLVSLNLSIDANGVVSI